jgi:probable F420-dependent oxidoreductase
MRWGLYGLHKGSSIDPETLTRRARRAEEAGFESLWVGDHVALPIDAPDPADEPRLELIVTLTYLAAATSRVRLATGVAILPMRHPVLLAKQLTSIDVLSQGRLIVGVGVGYVEPELSALGASVADRGARTDEHLAAMRALWESASSPPPASLPPFDGRFVSFSGVMQWPRPIQTPHPPIVCGGHSPSALRRAVQVADGWYGWELDPTQTARALADLREAEKRYGRPAELGDLEITITPPPDFDAGMARRYEEVGVHRLVLQARTSAGSAVDELIESAATTLVSGDS